MAKPSLCGRNYGWVVVSASFFAAFVAYGSLFSFGVFLTPLRGFFGWSAAATSGAFSLCILSYCLFSILSGWALDRLGPGRTILLGGLCIGSGLVAAGLTREMWHLYLAYGLLIGAGMSTMYGPLLATVTRWFAENRGLALGIVTAGSGAGNLTIPLLSGYVISLRGFRVAYVLLGCIAGGVICTASRGIRTPPSGTAPEAPGPPPGVTTGGRSAPLGSLIWERTFLLYSAIEFMVGFGLQMILTQVVSFVQEGPRLSPLVGATVLSTIGAASIAGRICMGFASDRIGRKRAITICTSLEGLAIIGLMHASGAEGIFLFALLFGFGYGGHVPQFPALAGELFGLPRLGIVLGVLTIFYGIGGALGPILAGYLFDVTGSYGTAFLSAALAMLVAALITPLLREVAGKDQQGD